MKVAVIGSGVIGLSTGVSLARKGYKVTIYAKDPPLATTSNIACGIWLPILAIDPARETDEVIKKYHQWAQDSWEMFRKLEGDKYGVSQVTLVKLFRSEVPLPYFADIVPNFTSNKDSQLPHGYVFKWSFKTYIIVTSKYLSALVRDFEELGGQFETKEFRSVEEILKLDEETIFNCTGLGARDLFCDNSMYPVKGQIILLPPILEGTAISDGECCVIPRSDHLALGALFQPEFETVAPTQENTDAIWSRIKNWVSEGIGDINLEPLRNVTTSDIQHVVAGLRPFRPQGFRVEGERWGEKRIIHNYGHGGSGITFSWGCALYSIRLMESLIENSGPKDQS